MGCIFDSGVVIAADTRATSGPIVADKVGSSIAKRQTDADYICPELRKATLYHSSDMVRRRWNGS